MPWKCLPIVQLILVRYLLDQCGETSRSSGKIFRYWLTMVSISSAFNFLSLEFTAAYISSDTSLALSNIYERSFLRFVVNKFNRFVDANRTGIHYALGSDVTCEPETSTLKNSQSTLTSFIERVAKGMPEFRRVTPLLSNSISSNTSRFSASSSVSPASAWPPGKSHRTGRRTSQILPSSSQNNRDHCLLPHRPSNDSSACPVTAFVTRNEFFHLLVLVALD